MNLSLHINMPDKGCFICCHDHSNLLFEKFRFCTAWWNAVIHINYWCVWQHSIQYVTTGFYCENTHMNDIHAWTMHCIFSKRRTPSNLICTGNWYFNSVWAAFDMLICEQVTSRNVRVCIDICFLMLQVMGDWVDIHVSIVH